MKDNITLNKQLNILLILWKKYLTGDDYKSNRKSNAYLESQNSGNGIFLIIDHHALLVWQFLRLNNEYKKMYEDQRDQLYNNFCITTPCNPDEVKPYEISFKLDLSNLYHVEKFNKIASKLSPQVNLNVLLKRVCLYQIEQLKINKSHKAKFIELLPKFKKNKIDSFRADLLIRYLYSIYLNTVNVGRREAKANTKILGEKVFYEAINDQDQFIRKFMKNSEYRKEKPHQAKEFKNWVKSGNRLIEDAPFCFYRDNTFNQ